MGGNRTFKRGIAYKASGKASRGCGRGNARADHFSGFAGMMEVWARVMMVVAAVTLAALIALVLGGCSRRVVYLPEERVVTHTDTLTRVERLIERDTLREVREVYDTRFDSVAPILDSLGNLLGFERWHFRERLASDSRVEARLRLEIDSLRSALRDSAAVREPYPVEVIKEVRKPLRWWERALIWTGCAALAIVALLLIWLIKRRR